MFTSKGLFLEVVCPYQSTCTLPKCLFQHPETLAQEVPKAINGDEVNLGDGDRPAKRQKVEDGGPTRNAAKPFSFGSEAGAPNRGNVKSLQTPRGDATVQQRHLNTDRPISPPPLRRKGHLSTAVPDGVTPQKPSLLAPTSASPHPPIVKESPIKAPLKQESLIPRSLKGTVPNTYAIRYKLIQLLHEQFTRLNSELKSDANDKEEKLLLSDQELIKKTLDLEEDAAGTPSIYSNIVKGKIGVYRKMTVPQWKDERAREIAASNAANAGKSTSVAKPQGPPIIVETGLTTEEELQILPRLFSPLAGLEKHGYITTVPTDSDIELARKGIEAAKGWEVCDRCKSRFQVFPGRREGDGALASGGACTYHYGKPYLSDRSASDPRAKREKRYTCCKQLLADSSGCTEAKCHVFKISEVKRMASVMNFEATPDNPERTSAQPVCIDGEMGYTVYGLELIRLTATSWPGGEELFDVLVRPCGEILDTNFRFSGISQKDIAEAIPWDAPPDPLTSPRPPLPRVEPNPEFPETSSLTKRKLRKVPSPAAARSLLFSYLSPQTPLIGHGLENDMNAVRIIHPTIIDTALLFPHKHGLPYRNALKTLMLEHLNKHVQVVVDGQMVGHDSMEDANAAGELVRFQLAKTWTAMQAVGWTFEEGMLKRPVANVPAHPGLRAGKKRTQDEVELEDGELDG
ncbi:RNA exonuclease 3 [Hyphodiscus hymeniophilus]|uniref:RNA exonuclease 3 n=1 Tax=Hyphodiscus hymeniophilus TaxID=353542 RepID=A0A9P7AU03_9HELO|nr:RNA exonuclease 3 [Hyphodiscus hymeniophilus]